MLDLRSALASAVRRVVECVIALVIAAVTLPMLVIAALASATVYRASPFFVHERVGRHGRPFRLVKIRTLPPATPHYADKFEIRRASAPRSMQLLRRLHLDELPQLWLVLSGQMSLVGPRPEMPVLHERIAPDIAAERVGIRPGITGLWQISVHCDGLICERTEYDRLYIRHRSVLLDAWILAETARKVLLGRRIQLFDVPQWAIGTQRPAGLPSPALLQGFSGRLRTVTIDLTDESPVLDLSEETPSLQRS